MARDRIIEPDPRNPGKYRARVWDGHKLTAAGTLGAYRTRSGWTSKPKARAWCTEQEAEIANHIAAPVRGQAGTLGAEIERWLDLLKLTAKSRRTYVIRCTELARVPARLRAVSLRDIDDEPAILEAFRASLAAKLAPATVRQTMGTVAMVLDGAVNGRRMSRNTARPPYLARLPRSRKAAPVEVELMPVDAIDAMRAALPPVYAIGVALMYGAGLRIGEAFGLKLTDVVALPKPVIRVQRQWHPNAELAEPGRNGATYGYGFGPPKHDSYRDVPVPESVLHAINAHVAEHGLSTEGTIMRLEASGRPCTEQQWHDVWSAAAQRAGVSARWTAHDMRHAFGSRHYNGGEPATIVARWLGHTLETFLRTYAHAEGGAHRPTRDLLDRGECVPAGSKRVPDVYRSTTGMA